MSYIGNSPLPSGNFSASSHNGNNTVLPHTVDFALGQSPGTENAVLAFIDGVRQDPLNYSVSGSTITFATAPPTGVNNVQLLVSGNELGLNVPADDSVAVDALDTTSAGTTGQFLQKSGASTIDWATVATTDTTVIEDDIALLGFKVAANGAFGKYNLVDQTEDAFMDATGVDAALSTNEVRDETNYYAGGGPTVTVTPFSYTGSDQAYSVPSTVTSLNFIAWGAGGGGGNASSGGGGGFIEGTINVTPSESLTVKVGGGGGINHVPASQPGGGGGGTGIYRGATVLAIAGAGGGGENAVNAGPGGGTTGGAGLGPGAGLVANGGTQVAGGAAVDGGGAGSLNQGGDVPSGPSTATGGYNGGGDGDGDNVNYTSGGGGGGYYGGSSGGASGSNHGSGAGGSSLTAGTNTQAVGATVANAGHTNYAAGTGNGGVNAAGQNGNAVIQYNAVSALTLVSTATEAEVTPTKGDIVMTYTNGIAGAGGVTAINTDLKAYASRDDGSTWTQLTLTAQGSTGSHFIVSSHDVDISSQPVDKTMRYKIETLNQSGSKETRIQAVSLGWS